MSKSAKTKRQGTVKTRPYWVKANSTGTDEYHRHDLLGTERTVTDIVRDAHGDVIFIPVMERGTIRDIYEWRREHEINWIRPRSAYERALVNAKYEILRQAQTLRRAGASMDEPLYIPSRMAPKRETRVIGRYADYCTINEQVKRNGIIAGTSDVYAPCIPELSRTQSKTAFARNPGMRDYGGYRNHRTVTRSRAHLASRQMTVLADSGEDIDEGLDRLSR